MRVLHIATRHRLGGGEKRLLHLIDVERSRGYDVHLAVGADHIEECLPETASLHRVGALRKHPNPVLDYIALRDLRRIIDRIRPDVVWTHYAKAGVLGRLAARHMRPYTIHVVHGPSFGPGFTRTPLARLFEYAERACARLTDCFVFVGEDVRLLYVRAGILKDQKSVLIHSPIAVEKFLRMRSIPARAREAARRSFGLHPQAPVALVVGSIEPNKRQRLILRELAPILHRRRLQLLIVGEGSGRDALQARADGLGLSDQVRIVGHVEDVERAFAAGDLLVHAAKVEGVSQVVVQALAAGLPVVATQTHGLREVASNAVVTGSRDGSDLRAHVVQALGDAPPIVPAERFTRWRFDYVEQRIDDLLTKIETLAGRRSYLGADPAEERRALWRSAW